jgi:dihydrolipoamide dehydrogenase
MSASEEFDVIIIGAGPGGYVAAIRAAQLGMRALIIDKRAELGGTCLNVGCIPSKALLHATHERERVGQLLGAEAAEKAFNLDAIHKHRNQTVKALVGGVKTLVGKRGVMIVSGMAVLKSAGETKEIQVGEIVYRAKKVILATGSKTAALPNLPFDGKTVVTSDEAIAFDELPRNLVVVGGGAIGLELGQVWSRMGVNVSVLEFLPQIAPAYDTDVATALEKSLTKRGMKIFTSTRVEGFENGKIKAMREGETLEFPADKVLVAVGRVPNSDGLGLENVSVVKDSRGRVKVDVNFETNVKGVFAIGDLIEGPMLAHKAEEDGVVCVERMAGMKPHVDYNLVPGVIYTDPEVASVGQTERQLNEKNIPFKVGKFPFTGNGRALSSHSSEGFAKVIAHAQSDRILGVQVIGAAASEMIAAAVAHMTYGGSAEDFARTSCAHPTLGEALKEAALATDKRAIHWL